MLLELSVDCVALHPRHLPLLVRKPLMHLEGVLVAWAEVNYLLQPNQIVNIVLDEAEAQRYRRYVQFAGLRAPPEHLVRLHVRAAEPRERERLQLRVERVLLYIGCLELLNLLGVDGFCAFIV